MAKCSRNLELRTHRSPCLKTNQKSIDETHNRLAASKLGVGDDDDPMWKSLKVARICVLQLYLQTELHVGNTGIHLIP